VTHLRKIMLEELERRNYSQSTERAYVRTIEDLARYFQRPPDRLGPDQLREYHLPVPRAQTGAEHGDPAHRRASILFCGDAEETLGDCRNPVPTQDLPTSKDSQSGRSSTAHQCGFLGVLSRPKRIVYDLLFWLSAETLLQIAHDPEHLGAEIGFFSVLHSWNQKLEHHPHIHCVVQAGGLSPDHTRWIVSVKPTQVSAVKRTSGLG
jgi:Putative transposase/Phage integrase, N-terminal SAM-like domain